MHKGPWRVWLLPPDSTVTSRNMSLRFKSFPLTCGVRVADATKPGMRLHLLCLSFLSALSRVQRGRDRRVFPCSNACSGLNQKLHFFLLSATEETGTISFSHCLNGLTAAPCSCFSSSFIQFHTDKHWHSLKWVVCYPVIILGKRCCCSEDNCTLLYHSEAEQDVKVL